MPQTINVSLPVTDLSRARAFYAALGFGFDDRFSGDDLGPRRRLRRHLPDADHPRPLRGLRPPPGRRPLERRA